MIWKSNKSLHVIRHSLELTEDVSNDDILAIFQLVQLNYADSFLSRHFTEEEQEILLQQLPNLTTRDEKTEKWLKKIRQTNLFVACRIDRSDWCHRAQESIGKRELVYVSAADRRISHQPAFLRMSLEEIPLSIAYAVWTGIGTMGAAVVGILFFKESKSPGRILCILGIIACVIGLRLVA